MNILQKIFSEHYEEMLYILRPRQAVIENVDKMINCGDPSYGGAMYTCECGAFKYVPFRCKSRFCPTCGNKYSIDRTTAMSFKLIHTTHRHCVFTIDEELRHFFLEDRPLLDCLFSAVRSCVLRMFHKDNLSEQFTPGFICVLHTFGRDLKWPPTFIALFPKVVLVLPVLGAEKRTLTLPVLDFMERLIRHIPEKHFKMIRYYGIYARHRESDKKIHCAISKEKQKFFLSFNRWRQLILLSFGYDPLVCSHCGKTMLFFNLSLLSFRGF